MSDMDLPVLSLCLSVLERCASLWHGLWVGLGCLQPVVGLQVTSSTARDNQSAELMVSLPREQGLVWSSPTPRPTPGHPRYLYTSLGEVCPHG